MQTGARIDPSVIERAVEHLGGAAVFNRRPTTLLDVHREIVACFPREASERLRRNFPGLQKTDVLRVVGTNLDAKQKSTKRLSQEQSAKLWVLARILESATEVFCSREEVARFLRRPALGLDNNRPIDLLATPAGVEIVEVHLGRVKFGVYT